MDQSRGGEWRPIFAVRNDAHQCNTLLSLPYAWPSRESAFSRALAAWNQMQREARKGRSSHLWTWEKNDMAAKRQLWLETEVGDLGVVGAFGKWGLALVVRQALTRKKVNRLTKGIGWPEICGLEPFKDERVMVLSMKPRWLWREVPRLSGTSGFRGRKLIIG